MDLRIQKPPAYRTEGCPAPGDLVRVQGFLNTWSEELGIEDFDTPESTERWLRAASLWEGSRRVTTRAHQQTLELRHLLRRSVLKPNQMADLERRLAAISFRMTFDEAGTLCLEPRGQGYDRLVGCLMSIIYNSMIDSTWSRFKCCALESCGWAFYDVTRSRTKRWCSMRTCGSRHKARQYYQRQR